ncbi:rhodanese-like domain-containing protein [Psychroserpens sp. XS_ASV72]|uniref:rhodanese-like domain-containing protein n=1 Tax=Psychroserpens sp. XS_ASV72 TaxID=3241293 RepID=UPI0035151752
MKSILFYISFFLAFTAYSQDSLSELLQRHNQKHVPYISVQELAMPKTNPILLDARESSEYEVSHIKGAIFVGYNDFNIELVKSQFPDKTQAIVVYCSLGIRSETIAKKLSDEGYTNVTNLYGGIFEWKNKGFSVYNSEDKETDSIHAFSKYWSKWLNRGIKVIPKPQ